jgi:hypothetical protein
MKFINKIRIAGYVIAATFLGINIYNPNSKFSLLIQVIGNIMKKKIIPLILIQLKKLLGFLSK